MRRNLPFQEANRPGCSEDAPASKLPAIFKRAYFFFFATLRVFFAVFFTALFAFFAFLAFLAIVPSDVVRWLIRCVHSGIEMHCIPNTPTRRKKQRPLKEVLTQQSAPAPRATIEPIAMLVTSDAENAGKIDTAICQACRKRLCRRRFRYSRSKRRWRERVQRESRRRRKVACVDSESRVLAMKKFSCLTDLSVAAVSQNRFPDEWRQGDSDGSWLLVRSAARSTTGAQARGHRTRGGRAAASPHSLATFSLGKFRCQAWT
jgi:hypothetical protein